MSMDSQFDKPEAQAQGEARSTGRSEDSDGVLVAPSRTPYYYSNPFTPTPGTGSSGCINWRLLD